MILYVLLLPSIFGSANVEDATKSIDPRCECSEKYPDCMWHDSYTYCWISEEDGMGSPCRDKRSSKDWYWSVVPCLKPVAQKESNKCVKKAILKGDGWVEGSPYNTIGIYEKCLEQTNCGEGNFHGVAIYTNGVRYWCYCVQEFDKAEIKGTGSKCPHNDGDAWYANVHAGNKYSDKILKAFSTRYEYLSHKEGVKEMNQETPYCAESGFVTGHKAKHCPMACQGWAGYAIYKDDGVADLEHWCYCIGIFVTRFLDTGDQRLLSSDDSGDLKFINNDRTNRFTYMDDCTEGDTRKVCEDRDGQNLVDTRRFRVEQITMDISDAVGILGSGGVSAQVTVYWPKKNAYCKTEKSTDFDHNDRLVWTRSDGPTGFDLGPCFNDYEFGLEPTLEIRLHSGSDSYRLSMISVALKEIKAFGKNYEIYHKSFNMYLVNEESASITLDRLSTSNVCEDFLLNPSCQDESIDNRRYKYGLQPEGTTFCNPNCSDECCKPVRDHVLPKLKQDMEATDGDLWSPQATAGGHLESTKNII